MTRSRYEEAVERWAKTMVDVELHCPDCRKTIGRRVERRLADQTRYSLTVTHIDGTCGTDHIVRSERTEP